MGFLTGSKGKIFQQSTQSPQQQEMFSRFLEALSGPQVQGFKARSKLFNFVNGGQKVRLGYLDFLTQVTDQGEIACNIYNDYNQSDPINEGEDSFYNTDFTTTVEPFSTDGKSMEWHRFYCPIDAQFFSYELTLNDRQIFCPAIQSSEFLMEGVIVWGEAAGRLID